MTAYVQEILDDMDVEARIDTSHNRRTINIQVDTNEPGRVIGYHGKVLKPCNFWLRTSYTTVMSVISISQSM